MSDDGLKLLQKKVNELEHILSCCHTLLNIVVERNGFGEIMTVFTEVKRFPKEKKPKKKKPKQFFYACKECKRGFTMPRKLDNNEEKLCLECWIPW